MRATKGSAKKAQWIQRVKEKKQARRCSSSPSSFVPSSPVSRLGHVLLQAQAERVETPGGGEPAGAELEAEVAHLRAAALALRGDERVPEALHLRAAGFRDAALA